MPNREIDVFLKFQSDTSGANVDGSKLATDLENVERIAKEADKAFTHLQQQIKKASTPQEFATIERQLKEVEQQVNDVTNAYRSQARVLRAEAAAITDDYAQAQIQRQRQIADQIGGASRTAFGTGVGILAGSFAWATKYVNDAKQATEVTRAWKAEQEKLSQASNRFGATLAKEALPLLRTAASLAEKASTFVEANPEIIRAALNTGVVLATLGAVGMAVSKGIKIYADIQTLALGVQQLAAAKLQDQAADKQLAAAVMRARMAGADVGGVTGTVAKGVGTGGTVTAALTSTGGSIAVIAGAVVSTLGLSAVLDRAKQGLNNVAPGTGDLARSTITGILGPVPGLGPLLKIVDGLKEIPAIQGASDKFLGPLIDKIFKLGNAAEKAGNQSEEAASKVGRLQDSGAFDQILKAYGQYKDEDLKLVQDHYRERNQIVKDALQAEQEANAQYAASVAKVNSGASSQLASLAADFAQANAQAEQQYQDQRAKIIRDGAIEIERIQQDSQKRLQKLQQAHDDKTADLISRRDALGLARENRDYKRQVTEEKNQTKEEIRQRRQDIALRLSDLKQSYEQERAQRLADYIARQQEIRAQAAERLKELATEHQEEIKKIREQKLNKLKELDQQFVDERKRRYAYMVQQLKDLDAGLFAINQHEKAYMEQRVAQIQAIIDQANAAVTATNPTGRASGGYAGFGTYTLGERGTEYVLSNRTTKAAEAILGGALTQDRILAAIGGRSGTTITVNANQRYSGDYTGAMRRAVQKDMQDTMNQFMKQLTA